MADDTCVWADRSWLQEVQYRTDTNLAARQSIYQYQHPPVDLVPRALDLADLTGAETVADIGCGNGAYLAELARRGHSGRMLGADLSAGMLSAARARAPGAGLIAADAAALPLRDGASELTLAMHMLYHVPSPPAAVRELRRVTGPGGQVLVALNGEGHLRELLDLTTRALRQIGGRERVTPGYKLGLAEGQELLGREFRTVIRHDFVAELRIPGPGPVEDYVRSLNVAHQLADPGQLAAAVARLVRLESAGVFRIRTHSGCLICC
jgi:SAM-dependent methyltransferase